MSSDNKEITQFLNGLTDVELEQYNIQDDDIIHTSVFMRKIYRDGRLVAIGGIAKWYKMFYHLYFMVKTDYQSKGIGSDISSSAINYAQNNNIPFMLGVAKISSVRSIKILNRMGYKRLWDNGTLYYSMLLVNKRYRFLRYILKVLVPVYHSPLGKPIKMLKVLGGIRWQQTD